MTRRAAIIGGGVIGGGWAARFLLNGWDVAVHDPDPDAQRKIDTVLANAQRALPSLYDRALPEPGALHMCTSLAQAVDGADWVQESVPERLAIKHAVYGDLAGFVGADTIVASSTSGFKPSELNAALAKEGQGQPFDVIVAHPFNPVYLLPLVELVGDAGTCAAAAPLLRDVGMFPLTLAREIDAHIADRLLEAVWRESLWLVKDGIATTAEIDDAIRMGFGLRWAQMGLFETYRIAGGEAGMAHFLAQFGPALEWPWTKLMDVPEFNDELVALIAGQSDAQSGHLTIRELERQRDDNLVGMLRALKKTGSGAGAVITAHEAQLLQRELPHSATQVASASDESDKPATHAGLPTTLEQQVPQSWTDYNGHMNETHYLEAGSRATDRLMELVGADADYIAAGSSYFTVENHVRYLAEVTAGDRLTARTRVLGGEGKKLHLFHEVHRGDGTLAATVETLLLHVDLKTRRTSTPAPDVAERIGQLAHLARAHPLPEDVPTFIT